MELVSPLTFGIVAALILFIVYMCIHRAEQFYGDNHTVNDRRYSKDEWEAFTAVNHYTPRQMDNICKHLNRSWPKNDNEWFNIQAELLLDFGEARNSSCTEDFEAYCDLAIDGRGMGHWVHVDTSTGETT